MLMRTGGIPGLKVNLKGSRPWLFTLQVHVPAWAYIRASPVKLA